MKKVLAALGIVLVVMIGAVAALPALIPAERIKTELSERVRAATGRPFTAGSVSVSVFPALAVQVRDAALGNPDGFSSMVMAKLGALDIRLKVFPLLHGQLEVDSFVVTAPMVAPSETTERLGVTLILMAGSPVPSPSERSCRPGSHLSPAE